MSELFTQTAIIATIAAALRLAMPLLLAGLGEMYGQRSGVLNLDVGRGMNCELGEVIAESDGLTWDMCLGASDDTCLGCRSVPEENRWSSCKITFLW